MNKFESKVKEMNEGSKILKDREKIKTEAIISRFPNGVHVCGVDYIKNKKNEICVALVCAELPNNFFFGGQMFREIVDTWLEMCNGDLDALNAELVECGGAFVKLESTTTRDGRSFTRVSIGE